MTGYDERSVERAGTGTAIALIDRLGMGGRKGAAKLTAFERDRVLAGIYSSLYGDRIDSTLRCEACGRLFDISFSLRDLLSRTSPGMTPDASPTGERAYQMADGLRFRLPTGEDELSIAQLSGMEAVRELLRRCVLDAPCGVDAAAVQDAMEKTAPILDFDVNTSCPECSAAARVRFDLQSYLLQSIIQDRKRLWRETHVLATAYRWGLREILDLSRTERRTLVSFIEADATRRGVL